MCYFHRLLPALERYSVQRVYLYSYVEDPPAAAVAMKIVEYANEALSGNFAFVDGFPSNQHGFGNIKKKMPALLQMARNGLHSFIITDLDTAECPPSLLRQWLREPTDSALELPDKLIFRVAVREIESWILADRTNLAKFLGISIANLANRPDELQDPKQHLLNALQRKGKKKWHKDMLPQGPVATIGPIYNEKLCQFVRNRWDPRRARANSPSLARALEAFK